MCTLTDVGRSNEGILPEKLETQVGKQLTRLDRAVNSAMSVQEQLAVRMSSVLRSEVQCAGKEPCPPMEQIVGLAETIRLAANRINDITSEYRRMMERVEL